MTERTILNTNPDRDIKNQPMFFGEDLGIVRFDQVRYTVFERLTEEQQQNYWRPHDINLEQDKIDYRNLAPHVRHIFDKNLAYQTVMDSVASRVTIEAFLPWASLPEVADCIRVWGYFEGIHNRSYQWIEQNLHNDPSVFFNEILRDPNIMDRAKAIIEYYDKFIEYSNKVKVFGYTAENTTKNVFEPELSRKEHKRRAYLAMVSINALEFVRFYVSFACTFALGQQNIMMGNAKEMKLIQRDENLHGGISRTIIRNWPKEDKDFAEIVVEEKETVLQIFRTVVEQEKAWAAYLFKDGVILGLSEKGVGMYIEHRANKALAGIGAEQIFETRQNPFSWINSWVATEDSQVAPQEVENDTYKVSGLAHSDWTADDSVDF